MSAEGFQSAIAALKENSESPVQSEVDVSEQLSTILSASRESQSARQRLGDPELLKTLSSIVDSHLASSPETTQLALRCIGNAFGDNDSARDSVIENGLSWALACLRVDSVETKALTIKVLYNFCSHYSPAQEICYHAGVIYEILRFCSLLQQGEAAMELDFVVDLLFWISGQKQQLEPLLSTPLESEVLLALLALHHLCFDKDQAFEEIEIDAYASLIETTLVYLRDGTVQKQVTELKLVNRVWQILQDLEANVAQLRANENTREDAEKLLVPLSTSLGWILSDLAAGEDFAKLYNLGDDWIKSLVAYLQGNSDGQSSDDSRPGNRIIDASLFSAASQVLGNLLLGLPTGNVASLVEQQRLDNSLFTTIQDSDVADTGTAGLLHSIAGLLIQLSRPSAPVREIMGRDDISMTALEKLCRHEMSQIKEDGIRLLRALGKECPANQDRFSELAQEVVLSSANSSAVAPVEVPS